MALALHAEQLDTIRHEFPARDQCDIIRLLTDECGTNLPLLESGCEEDIQRIRRAVLKLSAGSPKKSCTGSTLRSGTGGMCWLGTDV